MVLTKQLCSCANAVVYAGAPEVAKATELQALAHSNPNFKPIHLLSSDVASNEQAAELIKREHSAIDVVITNAGIARSFDAVARVSLDTIREHIEVNTLGPLVLFQVVASILRPEGAKFFLVSTITASISTPVPIPASPYAISKAAANMCVSDIDEPRLPTTRVQLQRSDLLCGTSEAPDASCETCLNRMTTERARSRLGQYSRCNSAGPGVRFQVAEKARVRSPSSQQASRASGVGMVQLRSFAQTS